MKKSKHITINLNEDQYNTLVKLAAYYRRTLSDITSLIVIDNSKALFLQMNKEVFKENNDGLKEAVFIPNKF